MDGSLVVTKWEVVADVKDGKTYAYDSVNKTFVEFTNNKVANVSGGTTCPAVGIGATTWA